MGSRGVLTKNYFIYPETVAEYGAEIERVMTETDRAMGEASEIIAKIASVTERIPSQIRSGELLEQCETAQAEIRSFDFLSYGKRVNQGLLNLLDQNQYITDNFIKKMETTTERMREFGAGCRRLTELIDYSGGSQPLKGLALAAVSNVEGESTEGEEDNDSKQSSYDVLMRAGAAEVLEVSTEEVMAQVRYINNLRSGQSILLNYMVNHRIGKNAELRGFINWITRRQPDLLQQLYDSDSSNDEGVVLDEIFNEIAVAQKQQGNDTAYGRIYNEYQTIQGATILADFLKENGGNIEKEQKPELIVPFLYFFHADKLIELYELKDNASGMENKYSELLEFYRNERDNRQTLREEIFYAYTWLQINSIESFTNNNKEELDFDYAVDEFVSIYNENIATYENIAEEAGVPPVVVAVIHYRESPDDFRQQTFDVRLHDGHSLDEPYTNTEGEQITFDSFSNAAIDALSIKQSYIDFLGLSYDSTDIVAMMCFAEAFNGLGYYYKDHISPYSYSGTDVYVSGKYTSDGKYDSYTIDQQIGTYRLLLAAAAGIYDAEDGKNYVNEMCGGDLK